MAVDAAEATLVVDVGWRLVLAGVLSLVGSPLSYRGADALGAVSVNPDLVGGPLVLGLTWAVVVPLALLVARSLASDQSSPSTSK